MCICEEMDTFKEWNVDVNNFYFFFFSVGFFVELCYVLDELEEGSIVVNLFLVLLVFRNCVSSKEKIDR